MKKIFCTLLFLIGISGFNFPQSVNWVKIFDKQNCWDLKSTSNGYLFTCFQYVDGLYMSTDSGATWTADLTFSRYIEKIAVDKNDIIYLATSGSTWSIYKSTDLGTTWSIIFAPYFAAKSLYAGNNGYIYAGSDDGKIIRSTDSGISWDTSIVTNNSITSITSTKNGQIFAGSKNGLFTSTNYGKNWTQLPKGSGNSIIADSNDYLYMDQYQQAGVSTDYGLTWNLYGNFPSYYNPSVAGLDYLSNVYISFGSIFKSSDRGLSWTNIGAPSVVTSIVPYHDKIFISTYNGIYEYDPVLTNYVGYNYFPLHLGNMYQYFETNSNNYFTGYTINTTTITRDTVINSNTYFNYSGWMRYSDGDKKIYKFVNPNDLVYMDFNKAIGDTFYQPNVFFNDINFATVNGGESKLFSQNYKYKGFIRVEAVISNNSYTEYFAENFGSFKSESYSYGPGGGTNDYSNIMMAILYDSLGNMHYFTEHHKPEITITPLNVIHSNNFNLNFNVDHYYNRNSGIPTEGLVNFIDSVVFESYYQKGDSLQSKPDLIVTNPSVGQYQITTTLDTNLMKKGFAFNYRIIAKDKGIIQETSISPDSGYYKCVWDFGQGIENKNNIPVDYVLSQNYPNPFNPTTSISFSIPSRQFTIVKVYDILGNEIITLVNEEKPAGKYIVNFNASNLHSGVYFYSIRAGSFTDTKKLILIK